MTALIVAAVLNLELLKPGECRVIVLPVQLYGEVRPVAFKCCAAPKPVCHLVTKET